MPDIPPDKAFGGSRPELRDRLLSGDDAFAESFAQEVRRHAPFFALIGGRARSDFEWEGYRIGKGAWVLLDLFGTNRDPRLWPEPETFRADRFLDRTPASSTSFPKAPATPTSHTAARASASPSS